jgi:hypothetical protein
MSYEIDIVEEVVSIYDNGSRWHGSFYDTADQSNAGATSVNKVRLNSTDLSSGVSIVSNSRITIANGGIYNIAFSAQLNKSGGGTAVTEIWLQKNGNNIANTSTEVVLSGNNTREVAAWNFLVQASAGDYYELCWHSNDTGVFLDYVTGGSNPTRPAIPSVILTVNQI